MMGLTLCLMMARMMPRMRGQRRLGSQARRGKKQRNKNGSHKSPVVPNPSEDADEFRALAARPRYGAVVAEKKLRRVMRRAFGEVQTERQCNCD
jgi:hypothetical protein